MQKINKITMTNTTHHWYKIEETTNVYAQKLTSLVVYNNGQAPIRICGRIIFPGKKYYFPSDGSSFSVFDQPIEFLNSTNQIQSAILEFKVVENSDFVLRPEPYAPKK